MHADRLDPRPFRGEPLALDLLNTEWMAEGQPVDFLHDLDGVRTWLAGNHIAVRATSSVLDHLVEARAAIRGLLTDRFDPRARGLVNQVLSHGRVRMSLADDGRAVREIEVDDHSRLPATLAAFNLLDLLGDRPERVRRCEHRDCVLWFLDTSRNGTRRWHSMATCGNRAKAQRHYTRSRAGGDT